MLIFWYKKLVGANFYAFGNSGRPLGQTPGLVAIKVGENICYSQVVPGGPFQVVPFQVVLFQVVQTDKLGRSSSLDSRDGSYISTLHLSSAMVITIKSLVSTELSFYL